MARTRFQRGDQADSDCVPADFENKPMLSTQTGGNETVTAEIPAQTMDDDIFSFTNASGDPGGSENITGLFRMGLDITVIDATISCFVNFRKISNDCTALTSDNMDEGDFTTVDTHIGTATFVSGAADRYQGRVVATNTEGHNGADGTLTLRTNNTDAFYEYPNAPGGLGDSETMVGINQLAATGGMIGRDYV